MTLLLFVVLAGVPVARVGIVASTDVVVVFRHEGLDRSSEFVGKMLEETGATGER